MKEFKNMKSVYKGNKVEIYELTSRIYFRKADLFDRGQCNGVFLVVEGGVGIVDAPPESGELLEEAEQLFGLPVKYLFLTHGHRDHFIGAPPLFEQDITVYCSRRLLEEIVPSEHAYRAAFVGVDGSLQVVLPGGLQLELFTPADLMHSKWDMFLRLEGGYLCTGDSAVQYSAAFFHGCDVRYWASSLRKMAAQPGEWLLVGHGDAPFAHEYLSDFAEFLTAVERTARRVMALHQPDPNMTEKQRFASISTEDISRLTDSYFERREGDSSMLTKLSGEIHARRQVRMVAWSLIREFIR